MPKSFSDNEREYLKKRLMEEANACLAAYGIRKTTVDELVRRVGIPKGTFYLFYESKDALIRDVILKLNSDIQGKMINAVAAMEEKPDADQLTDLIFNLYKSLDGSFLLKLIENGEIEFFMRTAPPEYIQQNVAEDDFMVGRLLALFPNMDPRKNRLFSGALRAIFLLPLYRKEIACDQFDEMLHLVIRGVVLQMFGGDA